MKLSANLLTAAVLAASSASAAAVLAVVGAASPAAAAVTVYEANLDGAGVAPDVPTPATGFGRVTYDDAAHTLRVELDFQDLVADSTMAHIHVRIVPALDNGMVAVQTPSLTGFPLFVTSGSYDHTFDLTLIDSYSPALIGFAGGSPSAAEFYLRTYLELGRAYIDVHSLSYLGGEIRGNLALAEPGGPIPEPATWALMIAGFGLAGATLRAQSRSADRA